MMRQWRYRQGFQSSARPVWVWALQRSRLIAIARNYEGFVPLETVTIGARSVSGVPEPGLSHFIDEESRLWFVNQVAHDTFRPYLDDVEVSVSRYGLSQGLGYNIPSSRSSQFGPVSGWTLVDAAGVPVQVMRVDQVFDKPAGIADAETETNYARFTTLDVAGDSGTYAISSGGFLNLYPAKHSRRGNRVRSGWIMAAQGLAGTGFFFVFEHGDPYRSRVVFSGSGSVVQPFGSSVLSSILRPSFDGRPLSTDDGVEVDDFIIMQSA